MFVHNSGANMTSYPRPSYPLGVAGVRLWRAVLSDYSLSKSELILLEAAARQADLIADLEAQVATDGLVVKAAPASPVYIRPPRPSVPPGRRCLSSSVISICRPLAIDAEPAKSSEAISRSAQASKAARARWGKAATGT